MLVQFILGFLEELEVEVMRSNDPNGVSFSQKISQSFKDQATENLTFEQVQLREKMMISKKKLAELGNILGKIRSFRNKHGDVFFRKVLMVFGPVVARPMIGSEIFQQ
jgi:hypothetical protein